MFKPKDQYIHFTRFGGVNKGEVEFEGGWLVIDRENKVMYDQRFIKTTKGFILNLDGSDGQVYLIKDHITDKFENNLAKIQEAAKAISTRTVVKPNGRLDVQATFKRKKEWTKKSN